MPFRFAGLCSGASSMQSSIWSTTSSLISVERVNFSPPWTTRWPTAWMSPSALIPGTPASAETSQRSRWSSAALWSRSAAVRRSAGRPSTLRLTSASLPMRSITPRASWRSAFFSIASRSVSSTWNLSDELPVLRTSTFMVQS